MLNPTYLENETSSALGLTLADFLSAPFPIDVKRYRPTSLSYQAATNNGVFNAAKPNYQ